MRIYEPDGHVVEIGESMEKVITRLFSGDLSHEQICKKTSMPKTFVLSVVEGIDTQIMIRKSSSVYQKKEKQNTKKGGFTNEKTR